MGCWPGIPPPPPPVVGMVLPNERSSKSEIGGGGGGGGVDRECVIKDEPEIKVVRTEQEATGKRRKPSITAPGGEGGPPHTPTHNLTLGQRQRKGRRWKGGPFEMWGEGDFQPPHPTTTTIPSPSFEKGCSLQGRKVCGSARRKKTLSDRM